MAALSPWLWAVFFAAGGIYAQQIEMRAQDQAFYIHGFIFFAFCVAGTVLALREALVATGMYALPIAMAFLSIMNGSCVPALSRRLSGALSDLPWVSGLHCSLPSRS